MKFEIYEDRRDEFRWRLKAANGRTIADSGEGYVNKSDCRSAIQSIKANARGAEVVDLTQQSASARSW